MRGWIILLPSFLVCVLLGNFPSLLMSFITVFFTHEMYNSSGFISLLKQQRSVNFPLMSLHTSTKGLWRWRNTATCAGSDRQLLFPEIFSVLFSSVCWRHEVLLVHMRKNGNNCIISVITVLFILMCYFYMKLMSAVLMSLFVCLHIQQRRQIGLGAQVYTVDKTAWKQLLACLLHQIYWSVST